MKDELKIFLTIWLILAFYINPFGSFVQTSVFALTISIVDDHSFSIDRFKDHPARSNFAYNNGKFYSITNPGPSLIAIPIYLVIKPIIENTNFGNHSKDMVKLAVLTFLSTLLISIPISALLAVVLYKFLLEIITNKNIALFVVFVFSFGTSLFFYSTIYSHERMGMFFSFLAFYLLYRIKRGTLDEKYIFIPALSSGIAVMFEYPMAVIWLLLFLYMVSIYSNKFYQKKQFYLYSISAAIPILLLMSYHYTIFDNPFKTGYHFATNGTVIPTKFAPPDLASLWKYTFSPLQGIFFFMPLTILCIYSLLYMLFKKKSLRAEMVLILIIFLYFLLFNVMYKYNICGYAAQYTTPLLPFIFIPFAVNFKYFKKSIIYIFSFISIFINYLPVLYGNTCYTENDLFNYYLPKIVQEGFSHFSLKHIILPYFGNFSSTIISILHIIGLTAILIVIYKIWK